MSGTLHNSPDPPHLKSLPVEIHAATRAHHTSLNRLITSRLPLCLPPHAHDASAYYHGISAFAEIFFAFEQAWSSVLTTSTPNNTEPSLSRTQTILRPLHLPHLLRTARLKHDLALLAPQHQHHHQQPNPDRARYLTSLTASIHSRIQARPHLLLAYTRTMYLALFNGGRWIRAQLFSASLPTTTTTTTATTTTTTAPFWPDGHKAEACLTFWHFDGDDDGEGVRDKLKRRFDDVAELLTETERREVVEEAVEILRICARVVEVLDGSFQHGSGPTGEKGQEKTEVASEKPPLPVRVSLTGRLYGLLVWMWALLLGGVRKTGNAVPARHGIVMRRAELKAEGGGI